MGKFLLRRLVYLVILVVIATSSTYFLAAAALNPRSNFEGRNPPPPPEVVDARLDALNLNDKTPIVNRFERWVRGVTKGNLGETVDGGSVNDEMRRRMGVSLRLLLIGSILGSLAGVAAGAYSAVKQYRFSDHAMTFASFCLLSIPTVVLSVFLANSGATFNNAVGQRIVYNTGEYTPGLTEWSGAGIADRLQHLLLPSLVLVLQGFAFYSRYQRNSMLDVLGNDFVRTAQAKGLRRSKALIKHALRTALIPMGTFFAYEFALIFIGSIFVEKIFSWHGMGEWFVQSIQKNDVNATAAIGMFVAVLVLIAGFLSDVVTVTLDPPDPEKLKQVMEAANQSRIRLVTRRFLRRRLAVLGLFMVSMFFVFAYLGPFFYKWNFNQLDFKSFLEHPSAEHWFGTTQNGFDMFALTMRGMQKSLIIGIIGALISTAIAAVAGAAAGYFSGWTDRTIIALIDLLLVLPGFLIIAILSPVFEGRTWLIFVLLLAAFQWMITARVVRSMTLSMKEREFVHAARFMGVSNWKIILRHILPNMSSFLIIDATINVSSLILAEVGLSFFGFGVQPPDISLGTLINDHWQSASTENGYQFYFPAVLLVLLVLSVNLVGDGLRDALDPNAEMGEPDADAPEIRATEVGATQ